MASTYNGDPLGCDIACTTGFPLHMRLCWGEENMGNACIRRLNADSGCLASIGDDPDYGFNVVGQLNASYDKSKPGALSALGGRARTELDKDLRMNRTKAQIVAGDESLSVYVTSETAKGPFALVLGVQDLTVDRLNQGIPGITPTSNL